VNESLKLRPLLLRGGAALLAVAAVYLVDALFALAAAAAALLVTAAAGWGLFHPRLMLRVAPAVLRWAFWLTLLAAIASAVGIPELVRQFVGLELSGSSILMLTLALFAVEFALIVLLGMVMAAVGALAGRKHSDPRACARSALACWWTGAGLLLFARVLGAGLVSDRLFGLLGLGLIILVFVVAQRGGDWSEHAEERLARWGLDTSRRLLLPIRGGEARLDLRGPVLGSVGAGIILLFTFGPGRPLAPLQHRALEALFNFRNAPDLSRGAAFWRAPSDSRAALWRERIVLVEEDPVIRRRAAGQASETRVLAEAVEQLARWQPLRIVVPVPQLDEHWPTSFEGELDSPPPGPDTARRNLADLPLLEKALRDHPNVVLAVPRLAPRDLLPVHEPTPSRRSPQELPTLSPEARAGVERLLRAAAHAGDGGTDWHGTAYVPALRFRRDPRKELPYLQQPFSLPPVGMSLVAAMHGQQELSPVLTSRAATIGPVNIPLIAPGVMLIDFGGMELLPGFPRVAYSTVLAGAPVYAAPANADREPERLDPARFFEGKIAIIQGFREPRRQTPIGNLTSAELVAETAVTLVSGQTVGAAPLWVTLLVTLGLAALVGRTCVGAAPFVAGRRAALALLLVGVISPAAIVSGVWVDPVAPALAIVLTSVLVSQITFGLEQDERRRHRSLLERVTAPQVVEELLDRSDQLALGGERRQVCILFADARNFTPFAESHAAEQVIDTINRYTTALTERLLVHGGILDRYTGDGLIARFDVTSPKEDVRRAVRSALAMRDAAAEVAAGLAAEGIRALEMGFGLHYGEAVVGLVGSPSQFHYTPMGLTVVIAARLEGVANGGEVLISEAVYELVAEAFECEPRGPVWLKGISEPVGSYRVLRARA
jgi:class 3 adenylate cyclase